MTNGPLLPDVHFQGMNRDDDSEDDTDLFLDKDDDEDLLQTPEDVIAILGFDPLKEDWKDGT